MTDTPADLPIPDCDPNTLLGLYIHVPFCATRCGYCDFNTYTAGELDAAPAKPGIEGLAVASPQAAWFDAIDTELSMAAERLTPRRSVSTVFVGGGTPSLLGATGLGRVMCSVRRYFELDPDVEVTTESNPESTSPEFFDGLVSTGFTRVSLGMQSAATHVLATLDRTHTPGRPVAAAREAAAAGISHINLDLIYGTPGERDGDLAESLDAVIDAGVDHVSAYALIVEDGTALARKIRRGVLPAPDDDVLASRYEMIDGTLRRAGLPWYEVSNWAASADAECLHNYGYWRSADWWGVGPGAHSHVRGLRWANRKHPARYAAELAEGRLPVDGFERLTAAQQHTERVMLTIRCRTGLPVTELDPGELARAEIALENKLLVRYGDALMLTDRGRLLADGVVRDLLAD